MVCWSAPLVPVTLGPQVFDSATASQGVLRVRCTLLENSAAGERLVAQRTFNVQRPAPTAACRRRAAAP